MNGRATSAAGALVEAELRRAARRPALGTAPAIAPALALALALESAAGGGCGTPRLADTAPAVTAGAAPGSATAAAAPARSAPSGPGAALPVPPDVWASTLRANVEPSARVAAIDLDGDGVEEIALASAAGLAVLRPGAGGAEAETLWSAPPRGGANVLAAGDLDGDGRTDLAVGWGVHRDFRTAPATLVAYLSGGAAPMSLREEVVATPATEHAQFTSAEVTRLKAGGPAGLLYAHFIGKHELRGVFAVRGAAGTWTENVLDVVRMAWLWTAAPLAAGDPAPAILVGRPYGDAEKSDGDVFVWSPGGGRAPLPTRRGVRSLAVLDLGGAGGAHDVCYGDGWHWEYGTKAEGLLTCARRDAAAPGGWQATVVVDTDSYEVNTLAAADLDGDALPELVSLGPTALRRHAPPGRAGGLAWTTRVLGPGGTHFAAFRPGAGPRAEIALVAALPAPAPGAPPAAT
ncbi:MAG TPA: VCBS repeat-containing protein, partial [Myxococcota bacterium]|nr:VCBS repeat-containing protein [Myxococcota bacterium]